MLENAQDCVILYDFERQYPVRQCVHWHSGIRAETMYALNMCLCVVTLTECHR